MKKNNKFRNNNGNSNAYSLNYKFDSISPAGKCSGTALDLIKRYNELAKEAHGSGDYIAMEVFRQYAEHYRKIVTEINERKNVRVENNKQNAEPTPEQKVENAQPATVEVQNEPQPQPKKFQVIEIKPENVTQPLPAIEVETVKKAVRRRKITAENAEEAKTSENENVAAV